MSSHSLLSHACYTNKSVTGDLRFCYIVLLSLSFLFSFFLGFSFLCLYCPSVLPCCLSTLFIRTLTTLIIAALIPSPIMSTSLPGLVLSLACSVSSMCAFLLLVQKRLAIFFFFFGWQTRCAGKRNCCNAPLVAGG